MVSRKHDEHGHGFSGVVPFVESYQLAGPDCKKEYGAIGLAFYLELNQVRRSANYVSGTKRTFKGLAGDTIIKEPPGCPHGMI